MWKALLESGILRSLQPARWGGGEVHLLEYVDAVMALSRADPSAGWVAGVIGVHPWQLALFDERAQETMWGDDPATMHSSSYNPTGKAETVEGGYQRVGPLVVLVGVRPLPRREPRCHRPRRRDARLPVVPPAARAVP